jgi:CRISPR-associated protein Csx10
MRSYNLKITLESPCLIGSGEGFGAIIDSDIVFDELGIPYIPSKRIKGCLRDSAIEVCEIFESAGIKLINFRRENSENQFSNVSTIFGRTGDNRPAPVYFSDLKLEDYETLKEWMEYFLAEYKNLISREHIIEQFTETREQTSINKKNGIAKEHSLRTIRVAKKGIIFEETIDIEFGDDEVIKLIYFACKNLRRIGTKRNRGFGEVRCELYEGLKEINFLSELEAQCKV